MTMTQELNIYFLCNEKPQNKYTLFYVDLLC